ncbi:hypothetical protein [Paludisphaera rhizosphaerae]|uniref:hypothetical protein n=1 Tax=Paludisphaera rhizosphaerae TaxID=2711216 RepID=UPI0013EDDF2E|nr:hypothetical protein [Paludisphaera rhizosphaerae]
MKKFVLKELILLSLKEEKARRVEFDSQVTLVKSKRNGRGKSCLIKSIYGSLGATAGKVQDSWKHAKVITLVSIEVEGRLHRILRSGKSFALFDADDSFVRKYTGITKGFGPFLANLLDFRLQLLSNENELLVPPPAYMFLPFYIDQDTGWSKPWNAFERLSQFQRWQVPVAEYHTGIRPNRYYIAQGEAKKFQEELKAPTQRRDVLKGIQLDLEAQMKVADFSIDVEAYREELRELLVVCDELKKMQDAIKEELVALYNNKTVTEAQIVIAKDAISQVRSDYRYASSGERDDHVSCPTCGVEYTNSFAERFAIALDEERCAQFLDDLNGDLDKIDADIASANQKYGDLNTKVLRANELLSTKQGQVELRDIIESEGRKNVQQILRRDILLVQGEIDRAEKEIEDRKAIMNAATSKGRTKSIMDDYREFLGRFLLHLDCHNAPESMTKKIYSTINATGSNLPRVLLAYFFSILSVMDKQLPGSLCPIIIDTPNQQEQDTVNRDRIYNFIKEFRPPAAQLILALVDQGDVDLGGKVIELHEKNSLLNQAEFEEHSPRMTRLLSYLH